MGAIAAAGWWIGFIELDLVPAALALATGVSSTLILRALARRAERLGTEPLPHALWMAIDTLVISWTFWIIRDSYPLWLIWYVIHAAAAAFVAGRRAAHALIAASSVAYLGVLVALREITGLDHSLLLALGRLLLLFGGSYFMIRGIAELREQRMRVATLHAEKSQRIEELHRLTDELNRRGRELAAANQRTQEANRAKSQFLANMSHELRTPLNSIIGFSEILTDKLAGRIEPRYEKFLGNILSSGRHLLGLINDILDLSKIEAGKMELYFEPVSLGDLVRGVESVMHSVAAQRSIEIAIEMDEELPPVVVDAPRVKQILYNLLSNAVKFSGDGARVTLRARRLPDDAPPLGRPSVALEVQDRGVGIRIDDQQAIFDEFRQIDGQTTRNMGGTGLGLALVKRFAEMHGGRVEVDSEPGQGSLFRVVLPLDAERAERRASGEPVSFGLPIAALESTLAPGDGPLVLVAEDDDAFFASLSADLAAAGYRVRRAEDGDEALRLVAAERPAAIVLDLVLPGRDGWDVLKRLKADPATAGIPVLIVSVVEDHELGVALGADDYFLKPLDRDRFFGRLRELAGAGGARRPKVLVIDDDPFVPEVLGIELEDAGYEILSALSGAEGLALAESRAPDVIVLDLVMDGMDGFRTAMELQSREATAAIPIVVFTSKELDADERRELAGRSSAVLSKAPEDRRRLLEVLAALEARRRTREESHAAGVGD